MRHENKGCDSEFIHIDPDEADLRDKYAAWVQKRNELAQNKE